MPVIDPREQYKTSANLKARGNIHSKYGEKNWFDWVAQQFDMPAGADVLDVGCGAGWFWASAAKHYPDNLKITLADRSEGMVAEAIQNVSRNERYRDVKGKTVDAAALPFENDSFDSVFAMHMLYHVPNPASAIAEFRRVLRPGGTIAISTNADDNLRELFDLGAQVFGGHAGDPAAQTFSALTAQNLLAEGFGGITQHLFEDIYDINDAMDVYDYLTSFPPGNQATETQQDALRTLISKRLAEGDGIFKVRREGALISAVAT